MKLKKIIKANDKALSKLTHLKALHGVTLTHAKELYKVAKRLNKLNKLLQEELILKRKETLS